LRRQYPPSSPVDTELDGADNSGGQHVVNVSSVQLNCPINGEIFVFPPMIPLDPCGLNSTNDLLMNLGVVIFPNPTISNFEIHSKSEKIEKIEILDFEGYNYTRRHSSIDDCYPSQLHYADKI